MISNQLKIQHLYLRAGFGETPSRIKALQNSSLTAITEDLFSTSKEWKDIDYLPYPLNESQESKGASPFLILKMILKSRKDLEELNAEWVYKMTYTKAVLREKMTFFWHNHFATSVPFAYLMQVQNNMLRKHALGSFRDLLHAVSKDPAMLLYLNNQENKKDHPNENFAREVMELFTLGIGHYNEQDIREAARAFTGWTVNAKGAYEFHTMQHDDGEKSFLGKKGNFSGEEILDILLSEKQTARHLVAKIYAAFVNPELNTARVEQLADQYYNSGYDTEALLRSIYSSEWFYDQENIGVKIVSPVELIVRYKKLVSLRFKKEKSMLDLQRALGQVLFFPPNVAGWKGDRNWIDSASLLIRLSIPQTLMNGTSLGLKARPAFEEVDPEAPQKIENDKVESDWSVLLDEFRDVPHEKLSQVLMENFLQCGMLYRNVVLPNSGKVNTSHDKMVLQMADILSLPEFQLI